jgi:hypothetical protein
MLEENPTTIGQKIRRALVGLFLGILVLMLIFTLLQSDMQDSLMGLVTGKSGTSAGSVGNRSIPMDYFNASKRECYFQYSSYSKDLASNQEFLNNCAFQNLRSIFVMGVFADSVGYQVTELAVKRELSRQARELQKESASRAGYGEEDLRPVEEIYRSLLNMEPIPYRREALTSRTFLQSFMQAEIFESKAEQIAKKESESAEISLRIIFYSDAQLSEKYQDKVNPTEEELKAEYDREVKEKTVPKAEDGNPLSFEDRKAILTAKLRLDKKSKVLEEAKKDLQIKKEDGASLEEIGALVGVTPVSFTKQSIQNLGSLSSNGQFFRLTADQTFLKDMSQLGFGSKKIGGPYQDGDKNFFVEFSNLSWKQDPGLAKLKEDAIPLPDSRGLTNTFLVEMSQSIGKEYPLSRSVRISGE